MEVLYAPAFSKGAPQVTLCNYEGTQTTRIAEATVYIRAGLEIGVAASKTFVCSLTMCVKCGKVGEFRASTIERLIRTIGEDIKGEIVGHNIEFHIVCQNCLDESPLS